MTDPVVGARLLIDKDGVRALIPHAGGMCLLDGVLSWNDDSIVCVSDTHRDPANPLRWGGRLSALHALEYGAQAVAVHGGLRTRATSIAPAYAFLAALRDAHLYRDRLDDIAAPLEIRARHLFGEGGNAIYQTRALAEGTLLAEARVTVILRPAKARKRGWPWS